MGTVRGNGVGKQGLRIAQYYPYLHPAGSAKADEYKHVILEQGQWALVWSSTTQCCLYVHDEATPGGFKIACTSVPDPITVRSFEFDEETNILTLEMTDDSVWPVDLSSLVSASSTIDNIERDGVVMTVTMTDGTEHTVNFAGMTEVVNNGDGTFSFLEAGVVKASWAAGAGGVDLSDYLKKGDIILTLLPTGWFELRVKGELIGTWTQGDKISADGAGQYTATKPDGSTITWFGLQEKTIASVVANPDGSDTVTITNPDLSKVVFTIPVVPAVPDVPEGIENLGMSIDLATGIVTFTNRDGSTISFRGTDEDSITLISVDTVARTITARNPDGSEVVFMYFDPANPPFYAHDESLLGDGTDADPLRVNWVRICTDLANGDGIYNGGDLIACTPEGARKVSRKVLIDDPIVDALAAKRYARFADDEDLADFDINGLITEGGAVEFPETAQMELTRVFTGGDPEGLLPHLASEEFAEILIMLPSEERTNFVGADTPWVATAFGNKRITPVEVMTRIPGMMAAPPLFRPETTNTDGWLTWRYLGEEPLHATIQGSFSLLLKMGVAANEVQHASRSILELLTVDVPPFEIGQGGRRRYLGMSSALLAKGLSVPKVDSRFMNDLVGFINPGVIGAVVAGDNLLTSLEPGTFSGSTPIDETADDPGVEQPTGEDQFVTNWVDISEWESDKRAFAVYRAGKDASIDFGTFSRVQWRDTVGDNTRIKYSYGQSTNFGLDRVYVFPASAKEVRFAFDNPAGVTVPAGFIMRPLQTFFSGVNYPHIGEYQRHDFHVNREVVFWPGGLYGISTLNDFYGTDGFFRAGGFRYNGGGFAIKFPASKLKKLLARKLFGGM